MPSRKPAPPRRRRAPSAVPSPRTDRVRRPTRPRLRSASSLTPSDGQAAAHVRASAIHFRRLTLATAACTEVPAEFLAGCIDRSQHLEGDAGQGRLSQQLCPLAVAYPPQIVRAEHELAVRVRLAIARTIG